VNRDYEGLTNALSSKTLTARRSKPGREVQLPVAVALWFQRHEMDKLPAGDPAERSLAEGELQRMAEAVIPGHHADTEILGTTTRKGLLSIGRLLEGSGGGSSGRLGTLLLIQLSE